MNPLAQIQARMAAIEARFQPPAAQPPAAVDGTGFDTLLAGRMNGTSSAYGTGSAYGVGGAAPIGRTEPPEVARARWQPAIAQAAAEQGLPTELLEALVWTESGFRADAVSHAGATGLTQLMPATAAGLGVDPNDPVQNLQGGARFLRQMIDRFGSLDLALAAYNAGPGRVDRAGGIPDIPETRNYVTTVLSRYRQLQEVAA
ncbi:MAG: lytic transglycosylase domain-containing protein [Acidimicrobiales bacterium]|jgi:soluble lytic murein transglycosylase-like protein|nr:lytic transglycosylase domain-containing protein [Acidimicrobiales bacterium]